MNIIDHVTLDGVTKYIKDSAGQAMLAPEEASTTAANSYQTDQYFILDGKLYKTTRIIVQGDTFIVGTNCQEDKVCDHFLKGRSDRGTTIVNNSWVQIVPSSNEEIQTASSGYRPIVPTNQHMSVFYGLATAAGDTTQSISTNAVGTYTAAAQEAIQNMLNVYPIEVIRL